jgi:hypothetical protein
VVEFKLAHLFPVVFDCFLDLVLEPHHLEVIFKLFKFPYILAVLDGLALLLQVDFLDAFEQGFPKDCLAVHQVLFLAEYVEIRAFELNAFTHGLNRGNLEFMLQLLLSDVALDSLEEVDVNVVFGVGQLVDAQDFVGACEEVDLGAVDVWKEGLEELEKDVLQNNLRQRASF